MQQPENSDQTQKENPEQKQNNVMDIEYNYELGEEFKQKGNKEFQSKNYKKAIEFYDQAIRYCRDQPSYFCNRAACYQSIRKYLNCLEDSEQALLLDPKYTKAHRRKAQSLAAMCRFQDAIVTVEKSLQIEKDKVQQSELEDYQKLKNLEIELYQDIEIHDYAKAERVINEMLLKAPTSSALQMLQCEIIGKLGQQEKAMDIYNKNFKEWDNVGPELYYLQGIIFLYGGASEKAKKLFQEGMKLDPDNQKCYKIYQITKKCEQIKEKGNQLLKDDKIEEAIQVYQEAISLDPLNKKLNSILYANKAFAYMKQKKYDAVINECDQSINLNENYGKAYLRRAEARMEIGEYERASFDYKKVQELDSTQDMKANIKNAQTKAKSAKKKDWYGILGLGKNCTTSEIKKKYYDLARLYHPDKHKGSDEATKKEADRKFKEISEAYQILSDANKRDMVDNGQDPNDQQGGMDFEGFSGGGGFNPMDIFSMFQSQGAGFGGGGFGGGGGGMPFNVQFSTGGGCGRKK